MQAVHKLSAGDTDTHIEIDREDEYGELASAFNKAVNRINSQQQTIEHKTSENRALLEHIFPPAIADRIERGEQNIANRISNVTVLFTSMRGFNAYAETLTPQDAVNELNHLISAFDEAAEQFGVEKIKTIGDSYMAACGLTVPRLDHARRSLEFTREVLAIVRRYNHEKGADLALRIGLHCGPVIAGVVGTTRFVYDVWGDTVNIASRIRFEADPNTIMITSAIFERLDEKDEFTYAHRISTKGMGDLEVWQWTPDWAEEEAETEIIERPTFADADTSADGSA
jgi:class 3 adenylate cyclase